MWLGSGWHFRPFILKMIRVEDRLEQQSKTMSHLMAISPVGVASCLSIPFLDILFYQQIPHFPSLSFQTLHYFFMGFPLQQNHSLKPLTWSKKKDSFFFCYCDVKKNCFYQGGCFLILSQIPFMFSFYMCFSNLMLFVWLFCRVLFSLLFFIKFWVLFGSIDSNGESQWSRSKSL
jgi:hypothetical protein